MWSHTLTNEPPAASTVRATATTSATVPLSSHGSRRDSVRVCTGSCRPQINFPSGTIDMQARLDRRSGAYPARHRDLVGHRIEHDPHWLADDDGGGIDGVDRAARVDEV